MDVVRRTAFTSLFVQVFFLLASSIGLYFPSDLPSAEFLVSLLWLEEIAQLIEILYYVYVLYIRRVPIVTATRYIDWMMSTPVMLWSAMGFMYYHRVQGKSVTIASFWEDSQRNVLWILLSNWVMLILGGLVEMGTLPIFFGVPATLMFIAYYVILAVGFARFSWEGRLLWIGMYIVWSLYGVAFVLPYRPRARGVQLS